MLSWSHPRNHYDVTVIGINAVLSTFVSKNVFASFQSPARIRNALWEWLVRGDHQKNKTYSSFFEIILKK